MLENLLFFIAKRLQNEAKKDDYFEYTQAIWKGQSLHRHYYNHH